MDDGSWTNPLLILDLGQHNVIVGRRWLAEKDVWMDVRNRRLVWPNERTHEDEVKLKMMTPMPKKILQRPTLNPDHQADMERRDQQFEKNVK